MQVEGLLSWRWAPSVCAVANQGLNSCRRRKVTRDRLFLKVMLAVLPSALSAMIQFFMSIWFGNANSESGVQFPDLTPLFACIRWRVSPACRRRHC